MFASLLATVMAVPVSAVDLTREIEELLVLSFEPETSDEGKRESFARLDRVVRTFGQLGELEPALDLAKKGRTLFPGEARSGYLLGWIMGLLGNLEEAESILRTALDQEDRLLEDPNKKFRNEARTDLAGVLVQLEKYKEAVALLESIRDEKAGSVLTETLAGLSYYHLGEHFLSARAYERAFRIDDSLTTPTDYFVYASSLDRMEQYDRAKKALEKAARRFPNASGVYLNLGLNAEARNATREAFLHYRMERLVAGEESPYGAAASGRLDRIEQKIAAKSVVAGPDLVALSRYLQLRDLSRDPSKVEEGIEKKVAAQFNRMLEENRLEHPYLDRLRSERLSMLGEDRDAATQLKKSLEKYPGQILFRIDLAQVYSKLGETEKTRSLISEALLEHPDHWRVRAAVGPGR